MKTTLRLFLISLLAASLSQIAHATHNRAGEIVIEQINDCVGYMVRCTIFTYTKTSSTVDRDSVEVCWGDGTCEQVFRSNGAGEPKPNDIKVNRYIATHTYSGPGRYTVSMLDPNRNGGIINVNPPASDGVLFYLQTTFTLFDPQFQGCNSTPVLVYQPVDYACIGQPFTHNPGAYDPDPSDSLSYRLIVPLQADNSPVPNYTYPNQVPGNEGSDLTLNEVDGTLRWINPQVRGEYNVAMIIITWRNGVAIDTTVRDMQILVFDCKTNHAPTVTTEDRICVVAGEVVEFTVTGDDPDPGDKVKLSALGSPFLLDVSPADDVENWRPDGTPSATYQAKPVVKTFRWQTACEHISDLDYIVVFKAEDDFFLQNVPGSTGLASLKAVRIKVVGPPPLDVQAQPASQQIKVSWEKPYRCENSKDIDFVSFAVWRREGSNPFVVDDCTPGLAGKGYSFRGYTKDEANGRYFFNDDDVERGRTYCYRVLARFAKRTNAGQYYSFVEGLASEEICVQLNRDVPLLTNVSVVKTGTADGQIEVRWTRPLADDLDTLLHSGPYKYELQRAPGMSGGAFTTVATFESPAFWQLTTQAFLDDGGLNTRGMPYRYQIAFYVNDEPAPLGIAADASSVFLQIVPTDNANLLSWTFDVPWVNSGYVIYRKDPLNPQWDSIGISTEAFYKDGGLLNGREYCYYVKALGAYGISGIPEPLVNLSQEACAVPLDNVAPCPPLLAVSNLCTQNRTCQDGEALNNLLQWQNPMDLCAETDDVVSFRIYYSPVEGGELQLIGEDDDLTELVFIHAPSLRGIAGCYAVTALDTFLNESDFSPIVCVDNCPNYDLPNAFTPNGDGDNEVFEPYPFCFIESIEMNIFNRWGEMVYTTKDPQINWNGVNKRGKELPEGTYYYTCRVFEQRVAGTVPAAEVLSGYIDLIR
jgi:gliding motility-associated-like protein